MNGTTYIPIGLMLPVAPAKDVTVSFTVTYEEDTLV